MTAAAARATLPNTTPPTMSGPTGREPGDEGEHAHRTDEEARQLSRSIAVPHPITPPAAERSVHQSSRLWAKLVQREWVRQNDDEGRGARRRHFCLAVG